MHCSVSAVWIYRKKAGLYLHGYAPQEESPVSPVYSVCRSPFASAHKYIYLLKYPKFHNDCNESQKIFVFVVSAGIVHLHIENWRELCLKNI